MSPVLSEVFSGVEHFGRGKSGSTEDFPLGAMMACNWVVTLVTDACGACAGGSTGSKGFC